LQFKSTYPSELDGKKNIVYKSFYEARIKMINVKVADKCVCYIHTHFNTQETNFIKLKNGDLVVNSILKN